MKKMSYKIVSKYLKEIKYLVPNAEIYFNFPENIKDYRVVIDIKTQHYKNNIFEIENILSLNKIDEGNNHIEAKVVYSVLVELDENIPKDEIKNIFLVKVPAEIYPNLRKLFITTFENSGFKDIKVEETIDFRNLYQKKYNQ